MDRVTNIAETGGVAVIVLAPDVEMPKEFVAHPQCLTVAATDLPVDREMLSDQIPTTTKLVLIGGEVPHATFHALRAVLDRRQVPYVHRKNTTALTDTLRVALLRTPTAPTATKSEGPVVKTRGSVQDLAREEADLGKGSAEEARRLFEIAQRRGIKTTVASLAQAIAKLKRVGGRTETPKSVMNAQQRALVTLDEAIGQMQDMMARLQLVREYVAETETLNVSLRRKLAKMNELLASD